MTPRPPAGDRRRPAGLWPLWLGLLAAAAFTALWLTDAPEAPAIVDAAPPDAGPSDAGPAPPPLPRLAWRIAPRDPIAVGVLDDCLASAGFPRALVVGDGPLSITHPGRVRPLALTPDDGGLLLDTPVEADARLAAALHVAVTACLYVEGAAVEDPLLDRRLTGRDWPQLGESGGLPVHHLVAVEDAPGGLRTRGLARLGRPDLALAVGGADRADARRILLGFAAAAVLAPPDAAELVREGEHRARPIAPVSAGWWPARGAADGLRVLAAPGAGPPQPVALPKPPPPRPPRPRDAAPRPAPAKDAPAPKDAPFRPAYR